MSDLFSWLLPRNSRFALEEENNWSFRPVRGWTFPRSYSSVLRGESVPPFPALMAPQAQPRRSPRLRFAIFSKRVREKRIEVALCLQAPARIDQPEEGPRRAYLYPHLLHLRLISQWFKRLSEVKALINWRLDQCALISEIKIIIEWVWTAWVTLENMIVDNVEASPRKSRGKAIIMSIFIGRLLGGNNKPLLL